MIAMFNLGKYLEVEVFAQEKRKEGKQEERNCRKSGDNIRSHCLMQYFLYYSLFLRHFI